MSGYRTACPPPRRGASVVQQLIMVGVIKGEVLGPGTDLGYHAIYYASAGYLATGVDGSTGTADHARDNARKAEMSVDFKVADATKWMADLTP